MNPKHLRLIVPAALGAVAFLPRIGYHTALLYTRSYEASADYLDSVRVDALQKLNLQPIPTEESLEAEVTKAALKYRLPPPLLGALVHVESHHNLDAYSPKGAIGLAQIMPFNAKRCGLDKVSKLWDEKTNLDCGAQILSEELKAYQGNLKLALIVYNGGPKAIKNKYKESYDYADKVIQIFAQSFFVSRSAVD